MRLVQLRHFARVHYALAECSSHDLCSSSSGLVCMSSCRRCEKPAKLQSTEFVSIFIEHAMPCNFSAICKRFKSTRMNDAPHRAQQLCTKRGARVTRPLECFYFVLKLNFAFFQSGMSRFNEELPTQTTAASLDRSPIMERAIFRTQTPHGGFEV